MTNPPPSMPEGMTLALDQAKAAAERGEVPVGAALFDENGVLITAFGNQVEQDRDPTAHAEMLAITQAAQALNNWRLEGCTLYVTLEPCPMCAGAIVLARIPRVVYGAVDPKAGAANTLYQLLNDSRLNHRSDVVAGVLGEACGRILSEFFAGKRKSRDVPQ
jgi:tRNA(adenine34) deaminase